jgi:hypothetical protein
MPAFFAKNNVQANKDLQIIVAVKQGVFFVWQV